MGGRTISPCPHVHSTNRLSIFTWAGKTLPITPFLLILMHMILFIISSCKELEKPFTVTHNFPYEGVRVGNFIQKPSVLGFCSSVIFSEVLMKSIFWVFWDSSSCSMFSCVFLYFKFSMYVHCVDVVVTSECIHLYFLSIVTRCLLWDVLMSCQFIMGNPPIV